MSLEVYHLQLSQSERIVWLLEELAIPYDLKVFKRNQQTGLSPEELKAVNPAGTAPYFRDTSRNPPVALSESGAIVEYVLAVYGSGSRGPKLSRSPTDPDYVQYVNWFQYANGTLQPAFGRAFTLIIIGQASSPAYPRISGKIITQLKLIDEHLASNKFFAGNAISAADIMIVMTLTTMRGFMPIDYSAFKNILRYLGEIAERPAYKEALRKGDDGMQPMIKAKERKFSHFEGWGKMLEQAEYLK